MNKSSLNFFHSRLNSTSSFQPSVHAGFDVLANTVYGQGLWATYYDRSAQPLVANSNQYPSQSFSPFSSMDIFYTHFQIRWSGFIQVNSSREYTFAFRCDAQHIASLRINDRMASPPMDYVFGRTVNLLLMTSYLHSGELHEIEISIQNPNYLYQAYEKKRIEFLWIEKGQPYSSVTSQLTPFPVESMFSSLSSSNVVTNDVLQFSWTFPLDTRVVEGMPMARGKGLDRRNSPLLLVINSGFICAATSLFLPSAFVTILTAGVTASFQFSTKDEFANAAESVPNISLWFFEKSRGHPVSGTISLEHTTSATTLSLPPIHSITSGLMAHYTADSFDSSSKIWNDLSGKGNHVTDISGTISVERPAGFAPYIQGSTAASIIFPATVLPLTYTLFYVARYNGPNRNRIFSSLSGNWLSGFWGNRAGVAHHDCWITPVTDHHGTKWVLASDRAHSFRSNGVLRSSTSATSCSLQRRLGINGGGEKSDFAVQIVIVYDRRLSDSEVTLVEDWLSVFSAISNTNTALPALSASPIAPVAVSFFPTLSGQTIGCFHERLF